MTRVNKHASRRKQRRAHNHTRFPSITDTDPTIDRYKQRNTTLHISLSTKDYNTKSISLHSCMTIESFFSSVYSTCGLEGQKDKVAAVAVKFNWLEKEPIVVREWVVDSYQIMLETIAKAPVWKDGSGDVDGHGKKKECNVQVKIFLKQ